MKITAEVRSVYVLGFLLMVAPGFAYAQHTPNRLFSDGTNACSQKATARYTNRPATPGTFPDPDIDVTYYKLDLTVSVAPSFLRGRVTTKAFALIDSLRTITLDLAGGMTVDSVVMAGGAVSFSRSSNTVGIVPDRSYRHGEPIVMDVYYRGVPASTGFGSFLFSGHGGTPWVWTLSEPYGASDWWPCKDHPLDKADSVDVWVTCNNALKVGSNGTLVAAVENGDGTHTVKWAERYPIATYLVSIALTNYAEFSNWFRYSPTDSMEILNYVLPEHLSDALANLPKTVDALRIFSDVYGMYPFINEKYGHCEFGSGGAMEHQTMTSTTSFNENTIAHELAHQWFGDMITCATWQDLWLNEGFATYSEAMYNEAMYGTARYWEVMDFRMSNARRAVGTLFLEDTISVGAMFQNDRVYSKGATVLHMLRHVLGDSIFFRAVRGYADDPALKYNVAATGDFQRVCESVSGLNLNYFFQQWVFGEKYPLYEVRWSADSTSQSVTLRIDQQTRTSNPPFFTMPVDVRLSNANWDTTVVVFHEFSGQEFTIGVAQTPTEVQLDPEGWILKGDIPGNRLPVEFTLDQNYPNPFNPGTFIQFHLPHRSTISLKIFDVLGREVATLVNGRQEAGSHTVEWMGMTDSGVLAASGIYFCRLAGDGFVRTRKLVLVR